VLVLPRGKMVVLAEAEMANRRSEPEDLEILQVQARLKETMAVVEMQMMVAEEEEQEEQEGMLFLEQVVETEVLVWLLILRVPQ